MFFSFSGGSTLGDLLQALEDYLPVLLGLVKDGKSCSKLYCIGGSFDPVTYKWIDTGCV